MYSLLKPQYSIPVHGEHRHKIAQGELAELMGVEKKIYLLLIREMF